MPLETTKKENQMSSASMETAHSPLSMEEFDLLKKTVLFTDDDVRYLQMAGQVLDDQVGA